jgi:hypothetical protein
MPISLHAHTLAVALVLLITPLAVLVLLCRLRLRCCTSLLLCKAVHQTREQRGREAQALELRRHVWRLWPRRTPQLRHAHSCQGCEKYEEEHVEHVFTEVRGGCTRPESSYKGEQVVLKDRQWLRQGEGPAGGSQSREELLAKGQLHLQERR